MNSHNCTYVLSVFILCCFSFILRTVMTLGFQIEPKQRPHFIHTIEIGKYGVNGGDLMKRIDSSMSLVKVCSKDADSLQSKLQNNAFSGWEEDCKLTEYRGFELSKKKDLIHKISNNVRMTENDIRNIETGIDFSSEAEAKIFEFTFGEKLNSGIIQFGMIAIANENDFLHAVSCLYMLNFKTAPTKGSYGDTNLGFATQKAILNFCRYKALKEFYEKNLVSRINDVSSLNNC